MSLDDSLEEPPTDAAYAADTVPVADDTAPVADNLAPDIDFLDEHIAVEHTAVGLTAIEHTVEHTVEHTAVGLTADEHTVEHTAVRLTAVDHTAIVRVNTPYDVITADSQCHAASMTVAFPCISGINPDHETWIRKTMLYDWGIHCPHEFQIRAIHRATFHRDELVYIIAKTGSGKSAIPLTVGSLLTGVVITLVPLIGLGSDQVSKSCNSNHSSRHTMSTSSVEKTARNSAIASML